MIGFADALASVLAAVRPLTSERVPLSLATSRVLAEDVRAPRALPPFDASAMDGYALALADLEGDGPWELMVRGECAAGGAPPDLERGTACRIFTGARPPTRADTVVMQERVERRGDAITIASRPRSGDNLRRRGEDLSEGAVALMHGLRLSPGAVALAAAMDRPELLVARRPVVTVLGSGDELRSPGMPGGPGSIPESNGYFVEAAARGAGAIARVAPFVGDDEEASRGAVADALRASDVLVTIGGVSVGDRDVMRQALTAAGTTIDFWKVNIKPGKPFALGRAGSTVVLALPGNPASASLTFLLFGVPLLRALQGDAAPLPVRLLATTRTGIRHDPGRDQFVCARIEVEAGELAVRPLPNTASGAVTSFAAADALIVVPSGKGAVAAGERVEVIRLCDM